MLYYISPLNLSFKDKRPIGEISPKVVFHTRYIGNLEGFFL